MVSEMGQRNYFVTVTEFFDASTESVFAAAKCLVAEKIAVFHFVAVTGQCTRFRALRVAYRVAVVGMEAGRYVTAS